MRAGAAAAIDPTIAAAIQYADEYGVIIVAAAGNSGTNNDNSSHVVLAGFVLGRLSQPDQRGRHDVQRQPGLASPTTASNRSRSPRPETVCTAWA